MKREGNLFSILISDNNITTAIEEVNRTHKFSHGRPNKTALWVDVTMPDRIKDIRDILQNGFEPKKPRRMRRYDPNARKWRDISEPELWPDQYIHHVVIQVLQPVMMRGMDYWCCGSIRERGTSRGIHGIKRWMKYDAKNTKYCAELDIKHFYDSLQASVVMDRMKCLVKDKRMLGVIEQVLKPGIMIGAYYSQWFANTTLQPLDHLIREQLGIKHYVRYMDNLTLFGNNKKELHRAVRAIDVWLRKRGMELKHNWQVFLIGFKTKTKIRRLLWTDEQRKRHKPRLPNAMGYRFGRGYTLLRKHTLLRTKRQLSKIYKRIDNKEPIPFRNAAGLISRLGQFNHCSSTNIRQKYVRKKLLKLLKNVVREDARQRRGKREWLINTCLERINTEVKRSVSCA